MVSSSSEVDVAEWASADEARADEEQRAAWLTGLSPGERAEERATNHNDAAKVAAHLREIGYPAPVCRVGDDPTYRTDEEHLAEAARLRTEADRLRALVATAIRPVSAARPAAPRPRSSSRPREASTRRQRRASGGSSGDPPRKDDDPSPLERPRVLDGPWRQELRERLGAVRKCMAAAEWEPRACTRCGLELPPELIVPGHGHCRGCERERLAEYRRRRHGAAGGDPA